MKTTLLAAFLCMIALPVMAQNFRAQSITVNTSNPDSCSSIAVYVLTYLGCINFVQGSSSYSINGSTIDLDVNYTSSPICAGAISYPVFNMSLMNIPSGTYNLVANAYLDNVQTNTINGPSITVGGCTTTGIAEHPFNRLKLYPNPVRDNLTIEVGELAVKNYQIHLYDLKGSEYFASIDQFSKQLSINVNELKAGVYLLVFKTSQAQEVHKIIIER